MRGLLQGSTLSPILFNFFINELVAELEMGEGGLMVWGKVVKALFFADDGALLAYDDERMAAMLDTCPLQLYGIDLPSTTNSLYLGFPFTHRGIDWKALATERCAKARKVVAGMRDLGMNVTGWAADPELRPPNHLLRPAKHFHPCPAPSPGHTDVQVPCPGAQLPQRHPPPQLHGCVDTGGGHMEEGGRSGSRNSAEVATASIRYTYLHPSKRPSGGREEWRV